MATAATVPTLSSAPRGDAALMARSLAYLFAAGSGLALLSLLLPRSVEVGELGFGGPIAAVGTLATAVVVALLLSGRAALRIWAYQLILAAGTALVTASIYWSGEPESMYASLYVLVALYAAYFFSRVQAALQIAFAGAFYGWILSALAPSGAPLARWLIVMGTLLIAAALVRALVSRLEALIEGLGDVARTDALTGLLNRRGFDEVFELELERAARTGRSLTVVVGDLDCFKALNDRLGHEAGDLALQRVGSILSGAKRRIDAAARIGGEEFALVVPESSEHDAYILTERLRVKVSEAFKADSGLTVSFGIATFGKDGETGQALLRAADRALYAAKELGRDRSVIHNADIAWAVEKAATGAGGDRRLAAALALAETLDVREVGSPTHSRTVGHYAELIARELGLPAPVVERVRIGGLLHDVGNVGVPHSLLNKSGPLSSAEWDELRKHPEVGARIVETSSIDEIGRWILAHHERPDGRGYPYGLEGEEIPLEARIIAVADAYEAMTRDRAYRRALEPAKAREELTRAAGSQFCSTVVDAFLRALDGVEQDSLAL